MGNGSSHFGPSAYANCAGFWCMDASSNPNKGSILPYHVSDRTVTYPANHVHLALIYLQNCVASSCHLNTCDSFFFGLRNTCETDFFYSSPREFRILVAAAFRAKHNKMSPFRPLPSHPHKPKPQARKRKLMDHRAVCLFQKEIKRKKN